MSKSDWPTAVHLHTPQPVLIQFEDSSHNYFKKNNFIEGAVTYFDKITMFSHKENQIDRLKYNCSQVGS